MFSVLAATRPVVNIARYALSNIATRSFIASPRIAHAKSETTSPEPTTQPSGSPTPAKRGRKPKEPKPEPTPKPNPKRVAVPEDMKPPKSPTTPYLLFVKDFFEKNPRPPSDQEANKTRFKECGAAWSALPDTEKERYKEAYRHKHEEYIEKKKEWFKNIDPAMLKTLNAARKASGKRMLVDHRPKSDKPLTAFFQFVKVLRTESADNGGSDSVEFSRHAGEKWRSMSEAEKQPYYDTYHREMSEWRARHAPTQA